MLLEVVEMVQAEEHCQNKESKLDKSHEIRVAALIILKHDQALIVLLFAKDLGEVLRDLVPVVINFFLMLFDISLVVLSISLCSTFVFLTI